MQVFIGDSIATRTLCYTVTVAIYSRWITCGTGIVGKSIFITMPVIDRSLNIIEVMAYEYYFVQGSYLTASCQYQGNSPSAIVLNLSGSSPYNCLKTENALQRGNEITCTTCPEQPITGNSNYWVFKVTFPVNFKIQATILLPEISQANTATSTDYSSNLYLQVRVGNAGTQL